MNRPFVFLHMLMGVDGRISGTFMRTPEETATAPIFREITMSGKYYSPDATLVGRGTAEKDFTDGKAPVLDETITEVPEGDYRCQKDLDGEFHGYWFVLDRKGKLNWQMNHIDYGGKVAHVVSVLTEQVGPAYRAFLREQGVSYIICGKDDLDYDLLLEKMYDMFGIRTLEVAGGSVLNWAFLRKGLVEELSLIITPACDADTTEPSVFAAKEGISESLPITFTLKDCKTWDNGTVWLNYKVNKIWGYDEYKEKIGFHRKDFIKESQ